MPFSLAFISQGAHRRPRRPIRHHQAVRVLTICGHLTRIVLRAAVALSGAGLRGRLADRYAWQRLAGDLLADAAERLGPTYIKFGQILATRVDVVPPAVAARLGRLFDKVTPPSIRPPITGSVGAALDGGVGGLRRVAAGSVAVVYRGRLRTGEQVAVKVIRPGIDAVIDTDLALLRVAARGVSTLPRFRRAPLVELVDQLGAAIRRQLDLCAEADALRRLRRNLAHLDGVRVPSVYRELSDRTVLVTEYLSDIRLSLPAAPPQTALVTAMRAAFQMVFVDGFVHCDLHPGNLHLAAHRVTVLDAGFVHELTPIARRAFAEFFQAMASGAGDRCAEILLATADRVEPPADLVGFRCDIAALVVAAAGRPAGEFNLADFAYRMFAAQRTRGLYADVQFVYPILALLVLEGRVRQHAPDVDFQRVAMPYVLRALADTVSLPGWRPSPTR